MKSDFKLANPMNYGALKENAKRMRRFATEAESVAWNLLRRKQLGVIFKRQYVIDDFIADFICLEKKLIVEIDGGYHASDEQRQLDVARDKRLFEMGYRTIRFENDEVIASPESFVGKVKNALFYANEQQ